VEPTATITPEEVTESPEEPTAVPTTEPTPEPTETPMSVATAVTQIQLEQIASGYTRPTFITHAFDDRLFIVEERGLVTILQNGSGWIPPSSTFRTGSTTRPTNKACLPFCFILTTLRTATFLPQLHPRRRQQRHQPHERQR
jgi:hypothetical protein